MYQETARSAGNAGVSYAKPEAYSYDYITVETAEKFAIEYIDCYEAMGWEFVKREYTFNFQNFLKTALTFKRDRKIENKAELNKLQVKIDDALNHINMLESSKSTSAVATALSVGTVGALTFGGGLCLCLIGAATVPAIIGGCVLGAVGLGLGGLAYLLYRKILAKKATANIALIDKQREEIGGLCEKAYKLINAAQGVE